MNSSPRPKPLVIDKSFAQGASATRLSELSESRCLLLPLCFYYEVMTSRRDKIYKTLIGLDGFRWVNKGILLTYEKEIGEPCLSQELPEYFVDRNILHKNWVPGAVERSIVEEYKGEVVNPSLEFWNLIAGSDAEVFSEDEMVACTRSESEFVAVCASLRELDRIRKIGECMLFPHAQKIDRSWFVFRFIQTFALQFLVLRRRYPDTASSWSSLRIEHDLHDMDYLSLGLHAGCLATFDASQKLSKASLAWRFRLLEPSFDLITT